MIVLAGVVVNLFFAAGVVSFVVSVLSLVLFSGFVLYDTSNIIHRYSTDEYIAGAMDLFLDAFNIFIALIRLLNGRD
jgi:FtsH-binding integral membrane protein